MNQENSIPIEETVEIKPKRGGHRSGAGRPKGTTTVKSDKIDKSDNRTRNWNIIIYPESAPDNWRDIIDETHIEWVESPLHDKDVNEKHTEGEENTKKPHYHVTLLYPSNKSYIQVKELTDSLNAPIPQKCASVKGSIRYMAHKDNPDKHQYDWNDIKCHGGADLDKLCSATSSERLQLQEDIINYIIDNKVIEFVDLVEYSMKNDREWFNLIMNYSTLSISTAVRSNRHKLMNESADCTDDDTSDGSAEAPVEAPTEAPTEAPADAPTEAPADAPADAPFTIDVNTGEVLAKSD